MADWDKQFVLDKLQSFKTDGQNALDTWREDRLDGQAIWNAKFRNVPPKDALYYPVVFYMLRHHVRAAVKTYMTPGEITTVTPNGLYGTDYEQRLAKLKTEELNYQVDRWGDMTTFIDDTFTQAEQIGCCVAKLSVRQDRQTVDFDTVNVDIDEVTGTPVESRATVSREVISGTHIEIEHVDIEDMLWDSNAKVWRKVRWVMQQNIEETEDELLKLIDSDGFDRGEVEQFIVVNQSDEGESNPREIQLYKRIEFWGYMQPNEKESATEFIRCSCDQDVTYLLKEPTTDVFRYPDTQEPLMPFQVGYLIRIEGEIVGESNCLRGKKLQAEINCIRDQRRRSIENELNEKWIWDKNAEVEIEPMDDSGHGIIIKSLGVEGVKELSHRTNTGDSYREMEIVLNDLYWLYGTNPALIGLPDPSLPDTAFGLNLMSNAANTVVFDNILHYNDTFIEPIFQKMLCMSMVYTPVEELEGEGIDIAKVERGYMQQTRTRLKVDCGYGATSEEVLFQKKMKAWFIVQQALQFAQQMGVEMGEARFKIFDHLREMLPLIGSKDLAERIPPPEQLKQMSVEAAQAQVAQLRDQLTSELENAQESGAAAGDDMLAQALSQGGGA